MELDAHRLAQLKRSRRLATGLLLLMVVIFVASFWLTLPAVWVGYIRAFSEAAMIGAIADWFAVTALFRHPLGIPIPHTAIVPKRKDRIGESLANFIKKNFLGPEVLEPKLERIDYTQAISSWLDKEENAKKMTALSSGLLHWLSEVLDNPSVDAFFRKRLSQSLENIRLAPVVGQVLEFLTTRDYHQQVLDSAVTVARDQLDEHAGEIRAKLKGGSPWYIPKFVDEKIYDRIVNEIYDLLDRIGYNREHQARDKFNDAVKDFIRALKYNSETIQRGEKIKQEILRHPALERYLSQLWNQIRQGVAGDLSNPDSDLSIRMIRGWQHVGHAVREDKLIAAQVNHWASRASLSIVTAYRDDIVRVISDTVGSWDAKVSAERIELMVGKDLQFIRINGTIVGGLVGVILHFLVSSWQG